MQTEGRRREEDQPGRRRPPDGPSQEGQTGATMPAVRGVLPVPVEEEGPVLRCRGEPRSLDGVVVRVPGDPPSEGRHAPVRFRRGVVPSVGVAVSSVPEPLPLLVVEEGQIRVEEPVAEEVKDPRGDDPHEDPEEDGRPLLLLLRLFRRFRRRRTVRFGFGFPFRRLPVAFRLTSRQDDRPRPTGFCRDAQDAELERPLLATVVVVDDGIDRRRRRIGGDEPEGGSLGGDVGAHRGVGVLLVDVARGLVGDPEGGLKLSGSRPVLSAGAVLPLEQESGGAEAPAFLLLLLPSRVFLFVRSEPPQRFRDRHRDRDRVVALSLQVVVSERDVSRIDEVLHQRVPPVRQIPGVRHREARLSSLYVVFAVFAIVVVVVIFVVAVREVPDRSHDPLGVTLRVHPG
mmetsp:Transcript_20168/g.47359  ORF Transcript_20168/g.47359 Transcript_20168/m.47359 type:complete len:400 (+) Transcript_20168:545-1744(+)